VPAHEYDGVRFGAAYLHVCGNALPRSAGVHQGFGRVDRTHYGHVPATIPVEVGVTRYEGGAVFDVTAQTLSAAYASKLLSATPHRIAFDADLRPACASCEGSGRSKDGLYRFALRRGKLSYVVVPGKGPAGTVPGLLDVGVNGTPHVKIAFAD